jgi:hypothetical protein
MHFVVCCHILSAPLKYPSPQKGVCFQVRNAPVSGYDYTKQTK